MLGATEQANQQERENRKSAQAERNSGWQNSIVLGCTYITEFSQFLF